MMASCFELIALCHWNASDRKFLNVWYFATSDSHATSDYHTRLFPISLKNIG